MTRVGLRVDRGTKEMLERAQRAARVLWARPVSIADVTAYCWLEARGAPFVAEPPGARVYVSAGVPDGFEPDPVRLRSALRWALPELVRNLEMTEGVDEWLGEFTNSIA